MKRIYLAVLLWMLAALGMPSAGAEAAITVRSFDTTISVLGNGDIDVTEDLLVDIPPEGEFHGIFRDIPVKTRWRERGRSVMEVVSVTLDGQARPADDVDAGGGSVRVFQRDRERLLRPGAHRFVLRYRMTGQVGMFEKNDELTWNVTGDAWEKPIGRATCTVVCPKGAPEYGIAAWLGTSGSREEGGVSWKSERQGRSTVMTFATRRAILPGEQLTVAAGWGKGYVTLDVPLRESRAGMLFGGLFAAILGYFCIVWWLFGRDPAKGVVIPLFRAPGEPPLSPAAVAFLNAKANTGPHCFGAALLSLAVKGVCTIRGSSKEGYEVCLGGSDVPKGGSLSAGMSAEEEAIVDELRIAGGTVYAGGARGRRSAEKGRSSAEVLHSMRWAMDRALRKNLGRLWIGGHDGTLTGALMASAWTFLGVAAAVAGIAAVLWIEDLLDEDIVDTFLGIAGMVLMMSWIGGNMFRGLLRLWSRNRVGFFIFGTALAGIGGAWRYCLAIVIMDMADDVAADLPVWTMLGVLCVPCVFSFIMDAPTPEARRLLDGIEGLAMYIGTAEKGRMNALNLPERSMDHYEKLLPYAVALGLEKAWGAYFADVLAAHAVDVERRTWLDAGTCGGFSSAADRSASSGGGSSGSGSSFGGGGGGAGSGGGGGGGGGC
ncbi:MAG: DUF2207 domain-containing protein [Mailhella sp.]|nr:DUF2207 domain-containing protein [Mailhella sp.]